MPGDGVGPEIVAEAMRVLNALGLKMETEQALVGGAAYRAFGHEAVTHEAVHVTILDADRAECHPTWSASSDAVYPVRISHAVRTRSGADRAASRNVRAIIRHPSAGNRSPAHRALSVRLGRDRRIRRRPGGGRDAEEFGGLASVAGGFLEGGLDETAFHLLDGLQGNGGGFEGGRDGGGAREKRAREEKRELER